VAFFFTALVVSATVIVIMSRIFQALKGLVQNVICMSKFARPICGFCGRAMSETPANSVKEARFLPYPLWRCPCTAIGSGEWVPDLDEVADQLLEVLGISERVSQPPSPIDASGGISLQYYDSNAAVAALKDILARHGYALQRNAYRDKPDLIHCLWVRKSS